MEELLFIWLLKKDMNKLFKFYWKKEPMLILQLRLFYWLFLFLFLFLFSLSHFSSFFSFNFFYFFLISKGWSNSSFCCCSKCMATNCSNSIGKGKSKCWSCRSGSSYFWIWEMELNIHVPKHKKTTIIYFSFFPSFSFKRMEKLHFIMLFLVEMNKLLNFYWLKEKQMPILKQTFLSFFFFFFF